MSMQVEPNGAIIDFDCATGEIDQPISVDRQGNFDVAGVFIREHGGPIVQEAPPDLHPARYNGQVHGKTMWVTVTLTDTLEVVGTFYLTYHQPAQIFKCL